MKIVLLFVFAAAAYAAACSASPSQSLCNYVVNVLPSGAGAPSSTDASSVNLVFSTTFPSSPPGASASLANGVVYTVAQGGGGFYNAGLPASPIYAQSGLYDGGSAPNVAGLSVTGLSTGNYTFTVWTYDAANPLSHNVYISTSPNNLGSPVASVPAVAGSASFSYQIQAGLTYQIAAQRIGSGRSSFNALQVSLPDNTPPSITCPTEQRIPLGTGCSATLGWPCPTVSDSCGFPTNGLQQTGLSSGATVSQTGLSGGVTYTATDLSGASSSCSFTVTVFDDIPPVLSGACPTGTLFATALPGQCVGSVVLPSNTLTASDNCGTPLVWYNVAGAYDTANGFDPVRGPYNAGSTVLLPVGTYSLQIRARGSIDYNSPSRFSTVSCTLPVQVVDLQPPVVCEPSQSVTGPCGSSAHQDWITTGGWAQVIDNCGQRRGQFLSSAPEFCGASPVFERRNFVFRDFGGNQVVYTGNVTYTTGDASCTCNYTRPLLTFDTDVTSNGGIVQIPESLPIPFESATVFDCLRQRVTTYNINKRAVACTVPEWHYNRSWSTTSPNSAAIYLPGNFPNCSATNSWVFQLVSPNYPLGLLVDFLTGVQQPIRWQQHYRFLDRLNQPTNDAATVWMSLYYNSANNGVETPLLHFPVPAYYIKSDCPHVNVTYGFSNYFVNASDLCTVTLNTDFWPDVIGHFLSNSTTSKRSVHVERIMDTIKEARQIPDLPESIFDSPIGFQVVNVINAWTQAGLGVPLSQFLLNSFDVSIDWVVVSNPLVGAVTRGAAKRVLPVPPVQPTGRYFHIDSVTVGNTGHNAFNTSIAYNTTLDNQLASCYNSLSNILVQQGVIPGQTVDITDPFYSGLGLNFTEITTCIAAVLSLI